MTKSFLMYVIIFLRVKPLEDLDHYTYGYVFGGMAIFGISLISLVVDFIPVIWIGGFIVGGSMFFKGLSNFSEAGSINASSEIKKACTLFDQGKTHESLIKIKSLKSNQNVTLEQQEFLKCLENECLVEIDNKSINGLITETENLINSEQIDKALENIDGIKINDQLSNATKLYLEALLARCSSKKKDYTSALQLISNLMNNNEYSAPVEDYIFKTFCEINLNKYDLAEKTMFTARKKFPNSKRLESFQTQIKPILYTNN